MSNAAVDSPQKGTAAIGDSGFRLYLAAGVLLAALVAYGIFLYIMWGEVKENESDWTREMLLFSGLEAIVFAGVGWVFGREVNRAKAESADEAQATAREATAVAAAEHEKGYGLAEVVRSSTQRAEVLEGLTGASRSQVDSLVDHANRLYPPRGS